MALAQRHPIEDEDTLLSGRLDAVHLRQRLAIEAEGEAPVFGRGRTRFHPENLLSLTRVLRGTLRVTGLYARGRRNARRIAVTHNRVGIARLPRALDGFRLLQISDLHLDSDEQVSFADVLAERLRGLRYDACVLTGDYRYHTSGDHGPAMAGLGRVRDALSDPVYAILGNHDSIRMVPSMEAMGIPVLLNEGVRLTRGGATLYLGGVDDPHFFRTDNLERVCAGIPEGAPSVLLAHSPELFRQAAACGFDLMLCGHTHGGQIRLPGGIPLFTNADCPRDFAAGAWGYRGLAGYTSVGAGSSIVDVRFNCAPEVCLHTLHRG